MFTPAFAWDSDHYEYLLPIGTSTHTYFVDYAVEQLQNKYPDAVKYRALLREGANIEFVGPLTENTLPHWVDIEERFAAHEATRFRAGDIEGWWNDALEAYRGGHPERAYFLLGVVLHFIQDVGVPAKAKNLDHGIGVTDFDSFEYMAAYNWTNPAPPKASEASPANLKTMLDFYNAAISKSQEDAPNYNDTSSFSNTWTLASTEEQDLLIIRQRHTALMTTWVLSFALSQFESITPSDPTCDVTICRPLYVFVFENAPMAATAKAETEAAIAIWLKAGIRFTPVYRTIKTDEIVSLLGKDLSVDDYSILGGREQFEGPNTDWDALFKLKPSEEAFAVFFVKVKEGNVGGLTNPAWADVFNRRQVYIGRPFRSLESSSSPPRTIAHELGHLLLGAACHKGSTNSNCMNRPTSNLMGGPEEFGSNTDISIQDGLRARARARRIPQSLVATPALGLDDAATKAWVVAGLQGAPQRIASVPNDALDKRLAPSVVRDAWRRLKKCRDSGQSTDLELAAAEHYLFARFIASTDGDTEYRNFPALYESLKIWASEAEIEEYLQTTKEPVSPVSSDVTRWGKDGIEAGLEDYEARTGKRPSNKWGSYTKAVMVAYSYYYRYLPKDSSCTIGIR